MLSDKTFELLQKQSEFSQQIRALEAKIHLTQQEFQKSLDLQKLFIHTHSVLLKIGVVEHEYFTSKHYDAMMMILAKLEIQYEKDSVSETSVVR